MIFLICIWFNVSQHNNFFFLIFEQQTIHDLFEVDVEEADASKRMAEVLDRTKGLNVSETSASTSEYVGNGAASEGSGVQSITNKTALGLLESALAAAEDETDVAAARVVRAEAAAEMDEFDESAPISAEDAEADAQVNKDEAELLQIEHQVRLACTLHLLLKFMLKIN